MSTNFSFTKLGLGFMVGWALFLAALVVPARAQAAGLSSLQVEAVVTLLQVFGVDSTTVANVRSILSGNSAPAVLPGSVQFYAALQPPALDLPRGTENVPFTVFTLSNNTSVPTVFDGLTLRRTGSGNDDDLENVVLLDAAGTEVGKASAFTSAHQATINTSVVLAAGQSATFTIAADIDDKAERSETLGLEVISLFTQAPLSGALPITGTLHFTD